MKQVVIENPVLNSPFEEPSGYQGITKTTARLYGNYEKCYWK